MKITSVNIEGFRSIIGAEFKLGRINLFAGKNSAGKTNIFVALNNLSKFYQNQNKLIIEDFHNTRKVINCTLEVQITSKDSDFIGSALETSDTTDALKKKVLQPVRDFTSFYYHCLQYTLALYKAEPNERYVYLGYKKNKQWFPLWGQKADKESNNLILGKFEELLEMQYRFVGIRDSLLTINDSLHSSIAEEIMLQFESGNPEDRAKYNKLRDCLSYIMEGIGGEIQPGKLSANERKFRLRYEVERKFLLPLTHSGEGAQRVCLILYYLINSPQEIIAIEEPETCLHYGAQRRFRATLDRLCDEYQKQLIISTHSSIFLEGWKDVRLFRVQINNGVTNVLQVKDREQSANIAIELGIRPSDAFVADGIIWVEGPSDIEIYKVLLSRMGVDLEENNVVIMSGGGDTLQHISATDFHRLNRNFAIVLDSDRSDSSKQAAKWKLDLINECKKIGGYGFITKRREIENYFSLNAIEHYYGTTKLPHFGHFNDFQSYVKVNILGRKYIRTRDGKEIAKLMTRAEIESLDDLYIGLQEIQTRASKWRGD